MLHYALPATVIVGGLVIVLAATFEEPSRVTVRLEHPVVVQAGQTGQKASSVGSVTSEQHRLQSEMDARVRALRGAATHQLEEVEAVITGPKASPAPAAAASAIRTAAAAATPPAAPPASPLPASVVTPRQPPPRRVSRKSARQVAPARHLEVASIETQLRPVVPLSEAPSAAPTPPAVAQLVSAAHALQENDAEGARSSLERAETSVVFASAAENSPSNSVAAARITEALRMVEAGNGAGAMQRVAQALTALQRAHPQHPNPPAAAVLPRRQSPAN